MYSYIYANYDKMISILICYNSIHIIYNSCGNVESFNFSNLHIFIIKFPLIYIISIGALSPEGFDDRIAADQFRKDTSRLVSPKFTGTIVL